MQYIYNPPLLVKYALSGSKWNTNNNKVLITFDDGPLSGNTEVILKKLNDYGVKSLFFCVGNNIVKNPSVTKEIIKEGHSIGNHTMNHRILSRAGIVTLEEEILPFNKYMEDEYGYRVKYFRPPHGRYSLRLRSFLKKNNLTNVMWSLLTYDYRGKKDLVIRSYKYLRNNSIVILHDNIKSSSIISDSIDRLMDKINENNFTTGSTEECLR
jgi:peptidoglycan-N-acetylglucosamine deacetylase